MEYHCKGCTTKASCNHRERCLRNMPVDVVEQKAPKARKCTPGLYYCDHKDCARFLREDAVWTTMVEGVCYEAVYNPLWYCQKHAEQAGWELSVEADTIGSILEGAHKEKTPAQIRKEAPVYSGFIAYFPDAMEEVARVSFVGNEQHNPGQPLHWDRNKSQDELDALTRHLKDHAAGDEMDTDGCRHLAKVAWRAMAALQKEMEKQDE